MIAEYLTWKAVTGVFSTLWSGLMSFIATPIGAALLASVLAYNVGTHFEGRKVNAAWQSKWDAAEKQAEIDRLARDALVKAKTQADADQRLKGLSDRKDELEKLLKDYEDEEAAAEKSGVANPCLTDSSDDKWLHDAQQSRAKPKARRGFAERLRAYRSGGASAGAER
jgi:hypothetical protein